MAYIFSEYGDDTIIKCGKCRKVVAVEYNPFSGPGINVTSSLFRRLEKHSARCSRLSKRHAKKRTTHK